MRLVQHLSNFLGEFRLRSRNVISPWMIVFNDRSNFWRLVFGFLSNALSFFSFGVLCCHLLEVIGPFALSLNARWFLWFFVYVFEHNHALLLTILYIYTISTWMASSFYYSVVALYYLSVADRANVAFGNRTNTEFDYEHCLQR